jgi:hypothetical protein
MSGFCYDGGGGSTNSNINILGYNLDRTIFAVDSTNIEEVARFGTCNDTSYIRLYAAGASNEGYLIRAQQPVGVLFPNFTLQATNLTNPSIYIQGSSGLVGVNTSAPSHTLTVNGDMYITGNIVQSGPTQVIQSEVIQSGSIYANFIYTSNVNNTIDFTGTNISNVRNAQFLGDASIAGQLKLDGSPFLHIMGSMQRFQVQVGRTLITSLGLRRFGFILAWSGSALPQSVADIFETTGSVFMSSPANDGRRQFHRFSALVDPSINASASPTPLPGLDVITDQSSMTSLAIGKTSVQVLRHADRAVKICVEWMSASTGYTANMKLDVFAPVELGTLTATAFLT